MTQPPRKRISKPLPGILRCEANKLEFGEFPVIANQSADWFGNLPVKRTTFRE